MEKIVASRITLILAHKVSHLKLKEFDDRNFDHLFPWETISSERPSSEFYKNQLETWQKDFYEGRAVRFLLFFNENVNQQVIGMCNFTNIVRGSFQACYLGYKIDYAYEGKGLMSEALRAAIAYVFETLNLHRIMANYLPENVRSAQLLKRLGFSIEGHAKEYLRINEVWRDHIMTALINKKWSEEV